MSMDLRGVSSTRGVSGVAKRSGITDVREPAKQPSTTSADTFKKLQKAGIIDSGGFFDPTKSSSNRERLKELILDSAGIQLDDLKRGEIADRLLGSYFDVTPSISFEEMNPGQAKDFVSQLSERLNKVKDGEIPVNICLESLQALNNLQSKSPTIAIDKEFKDLLFGISDKVLYGVEPDGRNDPHGVLINKLSSLPLKAQDYIINKSKDPLKSDLKCQKKINATLEKYGSGPISANALPVNMLGEERGAMIDEINMKLSELESGEDRDDFLNSLVEQLSQQPSSEGSVSSSYQLARLQGLQDVLKDLGKSDLVKNLSKNVCNQLYKLEEVPTGGASFEHMARFISELGAGDQKGMCEDILKKMGPRQFKLMHEQVARSKDRNMEPDMGSLNSTMIDVYSKRQLVPSKIGSGVVSRRAEKMISIQKFRGREFKGKVLNVIEVGKLSRSDKAQLEKDLVLQLKEAREEFKTEIESMMDLTSEEKGLIMAELMVKNSDNFIEVLKLSNDEGPGSDIASFVQDGLKTISENPGYRHAFLRLKRQDPSSNLLGVKRQERRNLLGIKRKEPSNNEVFLKAIKQLATADVGNPDNNKVKAGIIKNFMAPDNNKSENSDREIVKYMHEIGEENMFGAVGQELLKDKDVVSRMVNSSANVRDTYSPIVHSSVDRIRKKIREGCLVLNKDEPDSLDVEGVPKGSKTTDDTAQFDFILDVLDPTEGKPQQKELTFSEVLRNMFFIRETRVNKLRLNLVTRTFTQLLNEAKTGDEQEKQFVEFLSHATKEKVFIGGKLIKDNHEELIMFAMMHGSKEQSNDLIEILQKYSENTDSDSKKKNIPKLMSMALRYRSETSSEKSTGTGAKLNSQHYLDKLKEPEQQQLYVSVLRTGIENGAIKPTDLSHILTKLSEEDLYDLLDEVLVIEKDGKKKVNEDIMVLLPYITNMLAQNAKNKGKLTRILEAIDEKISQIESQPEPEDKKVVSGVPVAPVKVTSDGVTVVPAAPKVVGKTEVVDGAPIGPKAAVETEIDDRVPAPIGPKAAGETEIVDGAPVGPRSASQESMEDLKKLSRAISKQIASSEKLKYDDKEDFIAFDKYKKEGFSDEFKDAITLDNRKKYAKKYAITLKSCKKRVEKCRVLIQGDQRPFVDEWSQTVTDYNHIQNMMRKRDARSGDEGSDFHEDMDTRDQLSQLMGGAVD